MYEGEHKDDKRHGKGIEYDQNKIKRYEGEWKDDKCHGKGIDYYQNKIKRYEGGWKDGSFNGEGIIYSIFGYKEIKGKYKFIKPAKAKKDQIKNKEMQEGGRAFGLLENLGTSPNVIYLKKVDESAEGHHGH